MFFSCMTTSEKRCFKDTQDIPYLHGVMQKYLLFMTSPVQSKIVRTWHGRERDILRGHKICGEYLYIVLMDDETASQYSIRVYVFSHNVQKYVVQGNHR